ncbi:MAG: sigma-70 family RNA polymerase sigma factor [Candidatus Latescibacteria bacterium]|nr:sigma-70 family RNA polymerase sigma factor [Candidatus Latescibacterota bacterium]
MDRDTKVSEKSGKNNRETRFESFSDLELVREFKQGNEKGFDLLVLRYQERIYGLAFRMVRNEHDAWELSQETFIRAYKSLRKFKEKSSFYTWVYRICINLCLSFLKKSKKEKLVSSMETITENRLLLETVISKDITAEPESVVRQQKIAQAISQALEQLPLQQKLVFMMRQYDQLNNEEIAQKLKISLGGVKSNYHHAIKKLQALLKDWTA